MKRLILYSLVGLTFFNSCKSSSTSKEESSDNIILRVGDNAVTTNEFSYIYKKNNQKSENAFSEESINNYIDLYTKFKLKVTEAEALKLDTHQTFIKELEGYQKQLAKPYLTEKKVTDNLLQEAYNRKKQYVNSSHILIRVDPTSAPSDTLKAFNKITEIYQQAISKDFGQLAIQYSEDPSARMTGKLGYKGNLDYFTALDMVYEFENAAYNTDIDKISKPFRTQFGYHILKVHDKRIVPAKVKVAHIMINAGEGISPEDSIIAKNKIDEIYQKVTNGEDWTKLCLQFSQHLKTKNNNGELEAFAFRRDLGIPVFENVAFSLKKNEISKPFHSPYGWHIVKFLEKQEMPSFEESQRELNERISKDSRSKLSEQAFYKRLKKDNSFIENIDSKKIAFETVEESLISNEWKKDSIENNTSLFKIGRVNYSIDQFLVYVQKNQSSKKSTDLNFKLELLYQDFINESLYSYEESQLTKKYFSYKMLIKEYREGMLLFQLMSDKVWNKALKDTSGLKSFYETKKSNYTWNERANVHIYDVDNEKTLTALKESLKNDTLNKKDLLRKFNVTSSLTLNIQEGKFEKGKNDLLNDVEWKKGTYTLNKNNRVYYIIIDEILDPSIKNLNEIKGIMISEYQNYLEQEWLKDLEKKYPVRIIKKEVNSLVKK